MASSARSGALVAGSGVFKVGSTRCFFGRVQRQQWRCDRPQATGQSPSEAKGSAGVFKGVWKSISWELPSPEWGAARHRCEHMHWRK
ncbi:hypothetical protein SORBI_3002G074600 [Sorghum bicolor]|uniref:Uncharacterized protein n=1 Tax=Sorghum bicolor TaxID=4558 RepID=A0A1B6Q9R5_SORBI|nr:hypothetical protein SORBI_3002G074600 [Sorghum bicolor]